MDDISRAPGQTAGWMYQIEAKALKKLHDPERIRRFIPSFDEHTAAPYIGVPHHRQRTLEQQAA